MCDGARAKTPPFWRSAINTTDRPTADCVSPFPDHTSLYLLAAGILLGVLLSPGVLGRAAPALYENIFVGGSDIALQIAEDQALVDKQIRDLEQIGATDAAIPEHLIRLEDRQVVLQAKHQQARAQRLNKLTGWTTALMLAVIAMMMLEALVSPETNADQTTAVSPALGRLVTARYALTALWLALAIAQPKLLAQLPILFAGLLIAVALTAALIPLGPGKRAT